MDVVSIIKTNLTCQVCGNLYVDPRLLPCLHTFCCQCIETLLRNRPLKEKVLKCPTCQLDTGLDNRKAVRNLPANALLVSLLDLLLIQEGESVGCDVCDNSEESSAHVRCKECSVYLCELHAEAHKKARDTKHHVLLSLGKSPKYRNIMIYSSTCFVLVSCWNNKTYVARVGCGGFFYRPPVKRTFGITDLCFIFLGLIAN